MWSKLSQFLLLHLMNLFYQSYAQTQVRFCVPQDVYEYCLQMSNALPGSFICVRARDRYECLNLIARNEADTVRVGPALLYLAEQIYNLETFAMEEYSGKSYHYRSAVLIRKNSTIASLYDLESKKSCHAGFQSASGWGIPIGTLLDRNIMKPDPGCKGELFAAEKFFDSSCSPGKWSPDPIVDAALKKQHPKLCELCQYPSSCTTSDEYAGNDGAIKCLADNRGEVAFSTVESVLGYFGTKPPSLADQYQFLCLDGTRNTISNSACNWGTMPNDAWIVRKGNVRQKQLMFAYLQQVYFRNSIYRPAWFNRFFISNSNVTNIIEVPVDQQPVDAYLGNYKSLIERKLPGCEVRNVTICTKSEPELAKCLDLQKVALANGIRPYIRCNNEGRDVQSCIELVRKRKADIVTLDAGHLFNASRYNDIRPIAMERSNFSGVSYYAVAVLRTPSEVTQLEQLKGLRACIPSYGHTAGWTAPVGALMEADLLDVDDCDTTGQVSRFFRAACVPGAGDYRLNPNVSGASVLCQQCIGNEKGEHICEASHSERYYGNMGAFRCLAEGRGDVAFLDHHTPLAYTNLGTYEFWSRNLRPNEFRLLCKDGGQGFLADYERCNLAKIPSHYVAMAQSAPYEEYLDAAYVLTLAVNKLSDRDGGGDSFKMFGRYQNHSDLIFSDSTTGISALRSDANYIEELGDFFHLIYNTNRYTCENFGSAIKSNSILIFTIQLILTLFTINYVF